MDTFDGANADSKIEGWPLSTNPCLLAPVPTEGGAGRLSIPWTSDWCVEWVDLKGE
jgi:hypothetical protein